MIKSLLFLNGTILTPDGELPEGCLTVGGRIAALGAAEELRRLAPAAPQIVDLEGGTLSPGIIDSHIHLQWFASSRPPLQLDIGPASAPRLNDLLGHVEKAVSGLAGDAWLVGRGWTESVFEGSGEPGPSLDVLDRVSAGRPVVLEHFSGHALWANSHALASAGINSATPDPPGGRIGRRSGAVTGYVEESAQAIVRRAVPEPAESTVLAAIEAAARDLARLGVTSVTDPAVSPEMMRRYARLWTEDRLAVRTSVLLHWAWPSPATPMHTLEEALRYVGTPGGFGDLKLRILGAKLFADGVPAMRTAWSSSAYDSGDFGCLVTEGETDEERAESLAREIELLHRRRFSVQVHATGDKAILSTVRALADMQREDPWPGARHAVIHCNSPTAEAISLMAEASVGANINSLIRWNNVERLVGIVDEVTRRRMMPARSMLDAGVIVADSSDAPVTQPDWRMALQALVTRSSLGGEVCGPEERVSIAEALRMWTESAAWHQGLESHVGAIVPGRRADLVGLAEDLRDLGSDDLPSLTPRFTVIDGLLTES